MYLCEKPAAFIRQRKVLKKVMNKSDFLASLRSYLNGRISDADVNSNIDYYSAYIDGEISKGRSEEDVMDELGDPSLIARTLIDSVKRQEEGLENEYAQNEDGSYSRMGNGQPGAGPGRGPDPRNKNPYSSDYRSSYNNGPEDQQAYDNGPDQAPPRRHFPTFLIVIIIILIIFFGFSIFSSIFRFGWYIIRMLWPVILIIIIFVLLSGRRRR